MTRARCCERCEKRGTTSGKNGMPKKPRVFLDTSALLAGLNSPTGAAGTILAACAKGVCVPVVSGQVVEEAERNITAKFPKLYGPWISFLLIPPEGAPEPTLQEIHKAYDSIKTSDAPILAAAKKARPDALVTWDVKHFLKETVKADTDFPILKPEEFLEMYAEQLRD